MSYRVGSEPGRIVLGETDEARSVVQNVAMILGTLKGSVPLYRDFGISKEILDRPVQAARALLTAQVTEAVELYEPRAQVVRVEVEPDSGDMGTLRPVVEVVLRDG